MRRSRLAPLLVVLALAAGAFVPAAATSEDGGSVSLRLLDAPTDRRDDPRAHIYIVDHLRPGTTIERRVELANSAPRDLSIDLYVAGADIRDGSFSFFADREGNELSDWSSVDPPTVRVPSGGTQTAMVRIEVPRDASEGERYAVIWAELPAGDGGDVTVVNRVGVRIYLSVGPGGEPATDFLIETLTARRTDAGVPEVVATITNTGGRAVDMLGELTLRDGPGGVSAGPFPAELGRTLEIGGSGEVVVVLDPDLPDGPWHAELTMRSGRTERSIQAVIEFPEPGQSIDVPFVRSGLAWWLIVLAILLLLLASGALWWTVAARRRSEETQAETRPGGDTTT